MEKIEVPDGHTPQMYSTRFLLHKSKIGDILTIEFGLKAKKAYTGLTIDFVVMNYCERTNPRVTKKLALVPVEKKDNFKDSDILLLAETYYVECTVENLFPCNRRSYAGWRNKIVTIIEVK